MKRLSLLALLALAAVALGQNGTLQIAVDQSPVGLDPHIATAFSTFAIVSQVYEGLVEVDAQLQIQPALASSWDVSDDGLTYTFHLRPNVTFHNGRVMTSDDVVYSYDRVMNKDTGSPFASRFTQVDHVTAPDANTVTFSLKAPFAPFLSNLVDLMIVPKEVVEANGDLQKVAVGTGPFMFDEWVPDTSITLKANPNYYRPGEPVLAGLKYTIVPEASTRAAGIRTGTFQLLPDVDPTTAQTLKNASGVTLLSVPDLAAGRFGLNVSHPPLDDPRVREAINMAINRDDIIAAVYLGNAQAGGVVSPSLGDWAVPTDQLSCYTYDPESAKKLLAAAGYPDGFDMHVITFSTIKVVADTAQVIQAQLAEVGIRANIDVQEFGTFVQNWRNSDFDAFVSLSAGAIDPDTVLYRHFHTGGSANVYKYSDPKVDELLDQGETTVDNAERHDIYNQLQTILSCQGPAVTPAYGTLFSAVRDNVSGFQQVPTRSLIYLREVELTQP